MTVMALEPPLASPRSRGPNHAAPHARLQSVRALDTGAESWPRRADRSRRWLRLFIACRLGTAALAVGLLALRPFSDQDPALAAVTAIWAFWSVAAVRLWPRLAASAPAWCIDAAVTLALVLAGGEWRSPFYLLAVSSLVLPATALAPRPALAAAVAFAAAYFGIALVTGIEWDTLGSTARLESFATHLMIPLLVVVSLAYASDLVDDLDRERRHSEALALETERRRIGWELHDSAKQRIHAAHLVLTSLVGDGTTPGPDPRLRIAIEELEQAVRDIDASLTELRTSLGGQRLEEAVARRAAELQAASGITIDVRGSAPPLPTFVAVHAYRVATEAMVNAVRHARPMRIDVDVTLREGRLLLSVTDDGVGLPAGASADASSGLRSMEARARTLGGDLQVGPGERGGTRIVLSAPALGGEFRPEARTPS
jgi:signal transduction histidine kinase